MVKWPLKNSWRSPRIEHSMRFSHLFFRTPPPWNCNKMMLLKQWMEFMKEKKYYTKIKIHGSIPRSSFRLSVARIDSEISYILFLFTSLPVVISRWNDFPHLIFVFLPQNSFLCKLFPFYTHTFFYYSIIQLFYFGKNFKFRSKTSAHTHTWPQK